MRRAGAPFAPCPCSVPTPHEHKSGACPRVPPRRFPCCPRIYQGNESRECWVDDQACLHAALQSGAFHEQPHHARIDIGGEVLLNTYKLNKLSPPRVQMDASLLQYFPVGARTRANYRNHTTPCVLHFSGVNKGFMSTVARGVAADAWIVGMNYSLQRDRSTSISRQIHKAGDFPAAWRRTQRQRGELIARSFKLHANNL